MRRFAVGLFVAAAAAMPSQAQPRVDDYTKTDPKELGVTFAAEKKDAKTGFIVAGKNSTEAIPKLTEIAGRPVTALEKDMRPGKLSTAGFLGKDERLLDILAADNKLVVDEWGLTHQQLARHLHILGALAAKHGQKEAKEFTYHGRRFKVQAQTFKGVVDSPFEDGTKTNVEANVQNLDNGKRLTYSLLVPHMIERYGFYEGKGTRYRVEPQAIIEVLDFVKKAK